MTKLKEWLSSIYENIVLANRPTLNQILNGIVITLFWSIVTVLVFSLLAQFNTFAAQLPGTDASSNLEAAGTLLRILDTGIFKWGARIFAGLCIMSSGWALKEQRFGIAVICVIGAIIFGTAPKWVNNIFSIGGDTGIFSQVQSSEKTRNV